MKPALLVCWPERLHSFKSDFCRFVTMFTMCWLWEKLLVRFFGLVSSNSGFLCWPHGIKSVQFSSVTQLCPTLCNPMNRSMPGLPVHSQLPKSTQTHIHRISDAIQPSHPLSSPSPPAFSLSQHQGLFKWVSSSHQVAKVLEFQL